MGCKELLRVERASLRDVLEEACVTAPFVVPSKEQRTKVWLLNKNLTRPRHSLEALQQVQERYPEADAFQLVEAGVETVQVAHGSRFEVLREVFGLASRRLGVVADLEAREASVQGLNQGVLETGHWAEQDVGAHTYGLLWRL